MTLKSKVAAINRNSLAFLLHSCETFSNVELFSIFSQIFLELISAISVVETISCFVDQLSKKYCLYYLSEHLKYCSQINEYWLNKNVCLNIALGWHDLSINARTNSINEAEFMSHKEKTQQPWYINKYFLFDFYVSSIISENNCLNNDYEWMN